MSQEPENLLETDRLEEVLDEPGPPHPVVVIQYRSRVVPWLILMLLLVLLPMVGLLVQYRREAARSRAEALEARRELERLREAERAEDPAPRPPAGDLPVPVPAAKSPASAGAAEARTVLVSAGAGPATEPQAVVAVLPESQPQDPTRAPAQVSEKAGPTPATSASAPPAVQSGPPVPDPSPSARPSGSASPVVAAASVPEGPSPFEVLPGTADGGPAQGRADIATVPAAAGATVDPQPVAAATTDPTVPGAPAAEPPLPSLAETDRQIREEAAMKQREDDHRLAQQEEDLRALRDDDRQLFLKELRRILEASGKQAGAEIEELSVRAGRDNDPEKLMRAYRIIGIGRASQRTKVRQLRALGVSESVILDFLANGIDKNLGARNGPRNRNDVWVQAARRLLLYDFELSRPVGTGAGVRAAGGRPASTRPAGIRQPAAATARVR